MVFLILVIAASDTSLAQAESLLARHQLPQARAIAEAFVRSHPQEEQGHLLLGRILLEWPLTGRFDAFREFETARKLAPADPTPLYLESSVGFALRGDDGDAMARNALIALFRLAPGYRDAWGRFQRVFQNEGVWHAADDALALHPLDPVARRHRVELALAMELPARADSLAGTLLDDNPRDPALLQMRAEAAFEAGRDAAGYAWYDSARAVSALDSAGDLWNAVWMIATEAEAARYDSTPSRGRPRFYAGFWDIRDPDLLTPENERVGEHFRRLAYARRNFRLLHPLDAYFSSPGRRALSAFFERHFMAQMVGHGCLADDDRGAGTFLPDGSPDAVAVAGGLGPDMRAIDTAGAANVMARSGFDARGLVWIRYGAPDLRMPNVPDPERGCVNMVTGVGALDLEGWEYESPQGPMTIAFLRAAGPHTSLHFDDPSGDFLFMPLTRSQIATAQEIMRTDRTSMKSVLDVRGWSAVFMSNRIASTDVYFRIAPDSSAATIWDSSGSWVASARGHGLLAVTVPPGAYLLGFDAESVGRLGRIRAPLSVAAFGGRGPALSSLVLARGSVGEGREAALAAMPATLTFPAGEPLTSYVEVYGLEFDQRHLAHYTVTCTFAPIRGMPSRLLGGGKPITISFVREAQGRDIIPERLIIEPGRVPSGRYRVTVGITDEVTRRAARTVGLDIRVQ